MPEPWPIREFLADTCKEVQRAIGDLPPGVCHHLGVDVERVRWSVEQVTGERRLRQSPVVQAVDNLMLEVFESDARHLNG